MKSFSRSTRIALLGAGVLALFVGVAGAGVCPWDCQPCRVGAIGARACHPAWEGDKPRLKRCNVRDQRRRSSFRSQEIPQRP